VCVAKGLAIFGENGLNSYDNGLNSCENDINSYENDLNSYEYVFDACFNYCVSVALLERGDSAYTHCFRFSRNVQCLY